MGPGEWMAILSAVIAAGVTIITTLLSYRTSERKALSEEQQQFVKSLIDALNQCRDDLKIAEKERDEARRG